MTARYARRMPMHDVARKQQQEANRTWFTVPRSRRGARRPSLISECRVAHGTASDPGSARITTSVPPATDGSTVVADRAQPSLDRVAGHRTADRLGDDEPEPAGRPGSTVVAAARAAPCDRSARDDPGARRRGSHPASSPGSPWRAHALRGEFGATLATTSREDARGRRGCACAAGNRAPWHDDGCSAGRFACSW